MHFTQTCAFSSFFFQWPYEEFVGIVPNVKAPGNNEFIITMKKGPKKTDSMKFSTDHRADLLTEALVFIQIYFKIKPNVLLLTSLHILVVKIKCMGNVFEKTMQANQTNICKLTGKKRRDMKK